MAIRYHDASYVTTEIELGKSLSDAPAHLKTKKIITKFRKLIIATPFATPFATPTPLRQPPSLPLSTLLTLSVGLYAVLVYVYNPMEQTNNSFILAWLMQLTSAYALVEKYPAL